MGDSDDDYNTSSTNGTNPSMTGASAGIGSTTGGTNFNSFNNSKKNRDKFYREREDSIGNGNNGPNSTNNTYNQNRSGDTRRDWNNDRRGGNASDSWKNNRSMGMNQSSGYGNSSGGYQRSMGSSGSNVANSDYPRKYSHQTSPGNYDSSPPPYKRKKEWEMSGSGDTNRMDSVYSSSSSSGYHHSAYGSGQKHHSSQHGDFNKSHNEPEFPTQPPFLSFKLFLQQQDDNISDEEAIKKYNNYKIDFKKTQLNNFFLEHKEEEWFKSRYHPDENFKRRNEQNQFILNRCDVFMELMNAGFLENVSCEADRSKELIRFLDAVVIKLEGGDEKDLARLDDKAVSGETTDNDIKEIKPEEPINATSTTSSEDADSTTNASAASESHNGESKNNGDSSSKKRKSEDSGSESGSYTDSDEEGAVNSDDHKKKKSKRETHVSKPTHQHQQLNKDLHKTSSIFMRNLAPSVTKQDLENMCKNYEGFKRVAISDPAPERGFFRRGWITFESHIDVKKICWSLQSTKLKEFNPGAIVNRELTNRIRPISSLASHHKTAVKNDIKLAMTLIQNMDKRWNMWQDDSDIEQNVSVDQSIEEETDVNKTEEKQMDSETTEMANLEKTAFCKLASSAPKFLANKFKGQNPLLLNITDYLVDETNAEEEEFLGDMNTSTKSNSSKSSIDIEIDKSYNQVLDKLVLYLRVVHSIDFYNSTEYHQEDSMPNRCGIMFVRPALPVNAASACLKITQEELNTYMQQFELKLKPYLEFKEKIDTELAKKLGCKERKEEVEKFIKTNTQELAPDRWLCPLSGKKFKGPEFIRKHLFYKHMDKIVEVKKEIEYFNNYVYDPKRPQLPEHPSNKTSASGTSSSASPNVSNNQQQSSFYSNQMGSHVQSPSLLPSPMMNQMPYGNMQNRQMNSTWQQNNYMPDMMQSPYNSMGYNQSQAGYGGMGQYQAGYKKPGYGTPGAGYRGGRGGGMGGMNSREMIQYRDLDAPDDN